MKSYMSDNKVVISITINTIVGINKLYSLTKK